MNLTSSSIRSAIAVLILGLGLLATAPASAAFEKSIAICKQPTPAQKVTLVAMAQWVKLKYEPGRCSEIYQRLAKKTFIQLGSKSISDLTPVSELTQLDALLVSGNLIRDTSPLKKLTNLNDLNLENNLVEDLSPLQSLPNLEKLNLGGNLYTDIQALTALTKLTNLDITSKSADTPRIKDFTPLANMTKLSYLRLGYQDVTDLSPLATLTNLEDISLSNNNISDISPLRHLKNLKRLMLTQNRVHDISPLRELPMLSEIFLDANQIEDVSPFAKHANVSSLVLGGNRIRDLTSLIEMPSLAKERYCSVSADANPLLVCSAKDENELRAGKHCPPGAENSWYWKARTVWAGWFSE